MGALYQLLADEASAIARGVVGELHSFCSTGPLLINQIQNMRPPLERSLDGDFGPKFHRHVRLALFVIFFEKWLQSPRRQDDSCE
jgi:hypothetical protein